MSPRCRLDVAVQSLPRLPVTIAVEINLNTAVLRLRSAAALCDQLTLIVETLVLEQNAAHLLWCVVALQVGHRVDRASRHTRIELSVHELIHIHKFVANTLRLTDRTGILLIWAPACSQASQPPRLKTETIVGHLGCWLLLLCL